MDAWCMGIYALMENAHKTHLQCRCTGRHITCMVDFNAALHEAEKKSYTLLGKK